MEVMKMAMVVVTEGWWQQWRWSWGKGSGS